MQNSQEAFWSLALQRIFMHFHPTVLGLIKQARTGQIKDANEG